MFKSVIQVSNTQPFDVLRFLDMKKIAVHSLLIICGIIGLNNLTAQPTTGLVAYYSFENCDATNDFPTSQGQYDGVVFGNPVCDCGVSGQGLRFDGLDDYVQILGLEQTTLQTGNWSISMYFKPSSRTGFRSLISKLENCNEDNAFSVEYTGSLEELKVLVSETPGKQHDVQVGIDLLKCWQHLVITREGRQISIFLNGKRVAKDAIQSRANINNIGAFNIANSPCVGLGAQRFHGVIDELRIYERVLGDKEIEELFLNPDEILTRDTILFTGDALPIEITQTCASSFNWTPSNGVDMPGSATPTITPDSTTLYRLFFNDATCVAQDSIQVIVVNPGELDCDKIFFPTAFTPNEDGRNDDFGISNPFAVEELISFEVFNRWGERIFYTENSREKWDGRYKGKDQNPGVYLYKIIYNCQSEERAISGSVTLLK